MKPLRQICLLGVLGSISAAGAASETITYSYDAKARLTQVVKTGSVNNGVTVTYTHDNADNRKTVKVTGAP